MCITCEVDTTRLKMIQPLSTLVVVHVLGFISAVRALPTGAPLAACAAILPDPSSNGHQSAGLAAANSPFTFNVTALAHGYVGGTKYNMTLTGGTYEGLLIQGRLASDLTTPAGTFISLASTQIAPCVPSGSAITHTNNNLKNNLAFEWIAPPVGTGNVVFLYAVVISLANYYQTQVTATIPELISASPGPVGNITLNSPSVDQLTVAWAPPTTGGVPTSYNVSVNDSSSPVVIPDNGSSLYTHTFTGLTSDTLYTVSVVAINCAGTSNVTSTNRRTLAAPPAREQVVLVVNPDNTSQLNISWIPVGGSVTMYRVRVVTVGGISVGQGYATCTSSPCLYVLNVTGFATNTRYTIYVASINGDGAVGPESSTTIYGSNIASIDTPTAVGITFAITFIISFSMGMLVASIILCVCYIPRVSSMTTQASIPTTYEVVGINQKQTSTIELESNAAYGTAR